jgi:hypothetical protein
MQPLTAGLSREILGLLAGATLAFPAAAGAQESGTVVGRVGSEDGTPLSGAVVLFDRGDVGALTDETGLFRVTDVPAGRSVVRVRVTGFAEAAEVVHVASGDSVHLSFSLHEARIPMAGAGHPLPARDQLVQARQLLPEVLAAVRSEELVSRRWSEEDGSTLVWVPWAADLPPSEAGFRLRVDCGTCSSGNSWTVEGGLRYTVQARHLRLGVYSHGPRHLAFCLDPGEPGEVLMSNCHGSGRTAHLEFAQLSDGGWIRAGL